MHHRLSDITDKVCCCRTQFRVKNHTLLSPDLYGARYPLLSRLRETCCGTPEDRISARLQVRTPAPLLVSGADGANCILFHSTSSYLPDISFLFLHVCPSRTFYRLHLSLFFIIFCKGRTICFISSHFKNRLLIIHTLFYVL